MLRKLGTESLVKTAKALPIRNSKQSEEERSFSFIKAERSPPPRVLLILNQFNAAVFSTACIGSVGRRGLMLALGFDPQTAAVNAMTG